MASGIDEGINVAKFGDFESADAYDIVDADVDWSHIGEVVAQVQRIEAISDPRLRLNAAKAWVLDVFGPAPRARR